MPMDATYSAPSIVSNCTQGDLRLVGGSGNYEGNLQVCHNNVWGWVCHDSWDNSDAIVACRQMGFSTTSESVCWICGCMYFKLSAKNVSVDSVAYQLAGCIIFVRSFVCL